MKNLDDLLEFIKFTHEVRNVKRAILLETYKRQENDSEHMYQLALAAWFIIETNNLKLNKFKCVGMALLHDLAEGYAGDVSVHAPEAEIKAQLKREAAAIKRIKRQWPQFTSYAKLVDEYEEHITPEGKFVYALDKVLPVINIYLYDGRSWDDQNVSFEAYTASKIGKADIDPTIAKYHTQLQQILKNRPELFGTKK